MTLSSPDVIAVSSLVGTWRFLALALLLALLRSERTRCFLEPGDFVLTETAELWRLILDGRIASDGLADLPSPAESLFSSDFLPDLLRELVLVFSILSMVRSLMCRDARLTISAEQGLLLLRITVPSSQPSWDD